jgi:hypothetical protein
MEMLIKVVDGLPFLSSLISVVQGEMNCGRYRLVCLPCNETPSKIYRASTGTARGGPDTKSLVFLHDVVLVVDSGRLELFA